MVMLPFLHSKGHTPGRVIRMNESILLSLGQCIYCEKKQGCSYWFHWPE